MDEQLHESTACADGNVRPGDTLSPNTLLAEDAVPLGKEPCAEREAETNPPSKGNKVMEAEQHFCVDQASPADIEVDCKEQVVVSCNGKVESEEKRMTESVNEGNTEVNVEGKEAMHKGKTQAEEAEKRGAAGKDKPNAKGRAGASRPKRSAVPGLSTMPNAVGATAQKQHGTSTADTLQGQSERELLPAVTPDSSSRKDNTEAAIPNEADERPATDDATDHLSGSAPFFTRVDTTFGRELSPVPYLQEWEDSQDLFTIKDMCIDVTVEGQLMPMLMVHMEPHDYDMHPLSHPWSVPHLLFFDQESEQGRKKPTQFALPDT